MHKNLNTPTTHNNNKTPFTTPKPPHNTPTHPHNQPTPGLLGAIIYWILQHAIGTRSDAMGMAAVVVPLCAAASTSTLALALTGTMVPWSASLSVQHKVIIACGAAMLAFCITWCVYYVYTTCMVGGGDGGWWGNGRGMQGCVWSVKQG